MLKASPKTVQKQPFFRCKNSATDFGGVKSLAIHAPYKFQPSKNVSTFSPKDYIKEGKNGYEFSTRQCWLNRATKRRVSMPVTTETNFSGSTAIQAIQTPKGSIVTTTLPHDQRECCTAFNTVK